MLITYAFGVAIVLIAALFARLYVREMMHPGTRLILDPAGLHVRRPPETDFEGPWPDFYAVRVDRAYDPPRVIVTFVDNLSSLVGERAPTSATELHLPDIICVPVDELAAEIARFHKAYSSPSSLPDERRWE